MCYKNNNLNGKKSKTNKQGLNNFLPIILSVLVFAIIVILISNPAKYSQSVKNGFMLFANSVFPGLFPFLILTKILTDLGVVKKLSLKLGKFMNKVFKVSGVASYVFVMSALCGYPMGAKLVADFKKNNAIESNEAQKILSFCSVTGPIFAIGTVGVSMFGSIKVGIILYCCHIISALISGILFCNFPFKIKLFKRRKKQVQEKNMLSLNALQNTSLHITHNQNLIKSQTALTSSVSMQNQNIQTKTCEPQNHKISYDKLISGGVYNAISTILVVGAFVTLFFMLIDMVIATGILKPFELIFSKCLSILGVDQNLANGFLCGIIEMTRGCSELSKFGINTATLTLCSGLLSFSGFSIIMQCTTLLKDSNIKTSTYIFSKILHSILSMIICIILCKLFL